MLLFVSRLVVVHYETDSDTESLGEKIRGCLIMKMDTVFWRIIHQLVIQHEYRLIHLAENEKEIWLEAIENKQAPIVRVIRTDLDWSMWLQRDIENTAVKMHNFQKQLRKRKLATVSIYVSTYPPVDDWEFRVDKPYKYENTTLSSVIVHSLNIEQTCKSISTLTNKQITIQEEMVLDELALEHLKHSVISVAQKRIRKVKELFQHGRPFYTYIFIAIQLFFFYLLETNGGSQNIETLIQYGAKYNPLILEGEWWRFFTPIILHIGIFHLLMNTLALYYLGTAVERMYGSGRFLFIYLFAGFTGTVASFVFTPSISAGASGAIFGCFGALLYVGISHPKLFFRTMGTNILVLIGINISLGFVIPGIDNAGHIGGLIGGFLAATIIALPKQKLWLLRLATLVISLAIIFPFLEYGYAKNENDPQVALVKAQQLMEEENFQDAYSILYPIASNEDAPAEVYFYLSYVEIKMGELESAQKHLIKVTEMEPNFHEAHFNLAILYIELNELELALESVERAINIKQEDSYVKLRDEINRKKSSE